MMRNNYEILAPAGNYETFIVAISAGADAVYLGGQKFSARAKASNFSVDEIEKAVNYAHLRNKRVFVTVNILIADKEMDEAMDFVKSLYDIGVDVLILQDIGFAMRIKKELKDFELHASTQMTINNYYGAKFLENIGFSRVVLARETPLYELELIKEKTNLEIEVFIHGALCVSYSGQCLMSSMIGGKSGNRGECRGACRKSYELISKNGKSLSQRQYFLSPKDLNSLDTVKNLIDLGAYSLKIEGRLKNPEYVYQIVSAYKKVLDGELNKNDREEVLQIFNRGFTKGINNKDFGKNFISIDRPDNRGIEIGKVFEGKGNYYKVKFSRDIEVGDGLEFLGLKERFGQKSFKDFKKDKIYEININKKIKVPSVINRTFSIDLQKKLEKKINREDDFFLDLDLNMKIKKGEKAHLIGYCSGYTIDIYSKDFVEKSQNAPLSQEKIKDLLEKLGDTVFRIKNINIEMDEDSFLKTSQINQMRRKLVSIFEEKLSAVDRNEREENFKKVPTYKKEDGKIFVEISSLSHLKLLNDENIKIILRYEDLAKIDLDKLNFKKVYIKLGKIYDSKELEQIRDNIKDKKIQGIFINNISQIEVLWDLGFSLHADIGLNIFNISDLNFLKEIGFSSAVLSPELNLSQIKEIRENTDFNLSLIVYGKIPVMTMHHCPYALVKGCLDDSNCKNCAYTNYYLRDEKNVDFELIRRGHISEILNSYPIFLDKEMNDLKKLNISPYIISDEFLEDVYSHYKLGYNKEKTEKLKIKIKEKTHSLTKGHFHRGIL